MIIKIQDNQLNKIVQMRNKALILFTFSILVGCSDFDRMNLDPENIIYDAQETNEDRSTSIDFPNTISDEELAFAKNNETSVEGIFKKFSLEGMYNDYQLTTNLTHDIYAGFFANNKPGFNNESPYYVYTDRYSAARWDHFYRDRCKEYAILTRVFKYVNPEKYKNVFYITRIYFAFLAVQMVDTYGNIPFSDYVRGQNPRENARYDSAEEVYDMCFRILTEAAQNIDIYDTKQFKFSGNSDNCYKGDVAKWVRFANTLRLRMAIRISNASPVRAEKEGSAAIMDKGGLIASNEDNMKNVPKHAPEELGGEDIGGNENVHAMCSYIYMDVVMSKDLELMYKNLSAVRDPRMEICWYRPTPPTQLKDEGIESMNTDFTGCDIGSSDISHSSANYSILRSSSLNTKVLDKTKWFGYSRESVWLSYAETNFLLAEAALRGWPGIKKSAEQYFKDGIAASFSYFGILDRWVNLYTQGLYKKSNENPFSSNNNEKALEAIITQKWLAIFPNGNEGWAEFRRTDYPRLKNHIGNQSKDIPPTKFIKRLRYPNSEYLNNADNMPKEFMDSQSERIWWDVRDTNDDNGDRNQTNNFK